MKKDEVQAAQITGPGQQESKGMKTMEAIDTKIIETQTLQIEAH